VTYHIIKSRCSHLF